MTSILPKKIFPLLLIAAGLGCLLVVISPLAEHQLRRLVFPEPNLISPVDTSLYPAPIIVSGGSYSVDTYRQASNWFVKKIPLPSPAVSSVSYFFVSLPDINLLNVPVKINGTDLKQNAIHYPGTALPGDFGNVVVFGHSALSAFYRPGEPQTIFNPLLSAKVGTEIHINYAGFDYLYKVTRIAEVSPDEVEVLAQNFSTRQITLITCVPLGTYLKRLVVQAELVN